MEGYLVTVRAEDEFMIYQAPTVPNIDNAIPIEPSIFQSFKLVSAIHVPEGKAPFKPRYSNNGRMIMECFRDGGYTPCGGLGKHFQGKTIPVSLVHHKQTFRLGYKPLKQEEWSARCKGKK